MSADRVSSHENRLYTWKIAYNFSPLVISKECFIYLNAFS